MKTRQITAILMAATLAAGTLAGCGSNKEGQNTSSAAAEATVSAEASTTSESSGTAASIDWANVTDWDSIEWTEEVEQSYYDYLEARENAYIDSLDSYTTIGDFTTEDINGNTVTKDSLVGGNDLTLINLMATWCNPCVNEMPELEKLREQYQEQGIKFDIVAVVMDTVNEDGSRNEEAIEDAQVLQQNSGAQFTFIIPDETYMNGRAGSTIAYPESFFVDKDGNIVSDAYLSASDLAGWTAIVDDVLSQMQSK